MMKYRKDSLIDTMGKYTVLQMVGATDVRKDVEMAVQTQRIVICQYKVGGTVNNY